MNPPACSEARTMFTVDGSMPTSMLLHSISARHLTPIFLSFVHNNISNENRA